MVWVWVENGERKRAKSLVSIRNLPFSFSILISQLLTTHTNGTSQRNPLNGHVQSTQSTLSLTHLTSVHPLSPTQCNAHSVGLTPLLYFSSPSLSLNPKPHKIFTAHLQPFRSNYLTLDTTHYLHTTHYTSTKSKSQVSFIFPFCFTSFSFLFNTNLHLWLLTTHNSYLLMLSHPEVLWNINNYSPKSPGK